MRACAILSTGLLLAITVSARAAGPAAGLAPGLAGIGFLVGHWSSRIPGVVAETGGTSTGTISFTPEVGGHVLLRRDHLGLLDRSGRAAGGFDILMMIYPEAGTLHADYSDGQHVIHYASALVRPGRSVSFTSAASPGAPTFRLAYTLVGADTLDIAFAMIPSGRSGVRPIATGTAHRDG